MTQERESSLEQAKVIRGRDRVPKKDRTVDNSVPLKSRKLSATAKRIRALNKKLREIEHIQNRADAGQALDSQQQQKLDTLGTILAEMENLVGT